MDQLTSSLEELSALTRRLAEGVDADIADRENDFRSMCLWNIHNRVVMTGEIVAFYRGALDRMDSAMDLEQELTERMVTVTRDMFADVVSSIEKASKDCSALYKASGVKEKAMRGRSYLYLRDIMSASADMGYIGSAAAKDWESILIMRNLVAHNNSVSDRSGVLEMGQLKISMRPNRMMKGPKTTFVTLSSRAVVLFDEWLRYMDSHFI